MTKFVFKEDVEPVCMTEDYWYMLTDGGYIRPNDFLEKESAKKVKDAIKIIKDFELALKEKDLIEEM